MTAGKSCAGCPSLLSAQESVGRFHKSTGAAMCATFGTVLSRPGFSAKENAGLQVKVAEKCKSHGKPRPDVEKMFVPLVASPDYESPVEQQELVKTCTQCSNYLQPKDVVEKYGWSAGLCQIKGVLVLPHSTSKMAIGCELRSFGEPKLQPHELIPFYEASYHHVDLFKSYGAGAIHPLQHITDAPVEQADTDQGILAWRKISDPANEKRFTLLPIYNPELFNEAERAKIPQPGDDEHPELYLDHSNAVYKLAVCWRELDETPMAWGPAGVGKTEVARHMAYLMQLPFERFSITASTELDDLAGKMMFTQEKGTYFQYGRLPLAWAKPSVLLIDEPNTGQPDVWQFLRPLTDNSKQLVLDTASGERVTRHEHAYLMMAANPSWDPLNVGANTIGDADASRLMHLKFDLPPVPLEMKIISARVKLDGWEIEPRSLDTIMKVAADVRALCEDGTLPISWGVRTQIKVARAFKWFSPLEAYKLATDDLEPSAQTAVLESVKANFGDDDEDLF